MIASQEGPALQFEVGQSMRSMTPLSELSVAPLRAIDRSKRADLSIKGMGRRAFRR